EPVDLLAGLDEEELAGRPQEESLTIRIVAVLRLCQQSCTHRAPRRVVAPRQLDAAAHVSRRHGDVHVIAQTTVQIRAERVAPELVGVEHSLLALRLAA